MNAGTTYTPPLSGTVAASGPISAAVVDDAEAVAQPLDGGAGDEDRALEGVGHRAVGERPGDRREHALRSAAGTSAPTFSSTKLPVP